MTGAKWTVWVEAARPDRTTERIEIRVGARMNCDSVLHLGSSSHLLRTETGIPKLVIPLSTLQPIFASTC
jgi:hypothetical protein